MNLSSLAYEEVFSYLSSVLHVQHPPDEHLLHFENGTVKFVEKHALVCQGYRAVLLSVSKKHSNSGNSLPQLFGHAGTEETLLIDSFIEDLERGRITPDHLNTRLVSKSFVCLNRVTIADLLCFCVVYPLMQANASLTCLLRWFNYMQYLPGFMTSSTRLTISPQQQPKPKEKGKEREKEKEGEEKDKGKQKDKQKDKPEGKEKKAGSPAPAAPAVDIQRVEFKVAVIKSAKKHPDADRLYIEEVDAGEAAARTIVSGLAEHMPIDALTNRRVVIAANLKPKDLKGVLSQGMVLAATNAEGKLELLTPPADTPVGERIYFTTPTQSPADAPFLDPKLKIFEAVSLDLQTNDACVACYKGVAMTTSKGPIVVPSNKNCQIK